jgi:hypothetical protein
VSAGKAAPVAFGFGIDDEVYLALPIERRRLRAVPRNRTEAHPFEQPVQLRHVGCGVFDKFESVSSYRIFPERVHENAFVADETNIVSSETFRRST